VARQRRTLQEDQEDMNKKAAEVLDQGTMKVRAPPDTAATSPNHPRPALCSQIHISFLYMYSSTLYLKTFISK
jgi:hypothetical protein